MFRPAANVLLRRAQLVLMLVALVPTILITAVGIILLAVGKSSINVVLGVLVLAFCTSSVTGYILGSIFINRGASLARLQNDFLSSVSHEIRTPMTSMKVFIETLRQDRVTDPVERKKCLQIIEQEMTRLDGLVSKLIDLSKIESGRQAFDRVPVDVADVIEEALNAFEAAKMGSEASAAPGMRPNLQLDVQEEPGLIVVGDRHALAQAVANLLTNAWKYTGSHKTIELRTGRRGKFVEITVVDNGPGIPREDQDRIFDSFERGRSAIDGQAAGSGLGLAIVRAIARAHRGEVELASVENGSRFSLLIPLPT